jgi:hypothetical protein
VGTWDTGELPTPAANAWIRHTVSGTIPTAAVLARGYYWMQRNAAAALSVVSLDDAMFSVGEVLPEWTGRGDELLNGVVTTPIIADEAASAPRAFFDATASAIVLSLGTTTLATLTFTSTGNPIEVQGSVELGVFELADIRIRLREGSTVIYSSETRRVSRAFQDFPMVPLLRQPAAGSVTYTLELDAITLITPESATGQFLLQLRNRAIRATEIKR